MIVFLWENWDDIKAHILPLWRLHYAEIAEDKERIRLDPDWDKYQALADQGKLHIVTARHAGKLIGYVFVVVDTHIHYRTTLFGFFDIYWLHPDHRGPRVAVRMFTYAEKTLAARGVVKMINNTKLAHDHGRLFQALGWREAERIYVKVPR